MSKNRKKRTKKYTGDDAAKPPMVHRYVAVARSPLGEWWHERKRAIKIGGMIAGGVLVFAYLIFELFRLVF